RRRDRSHQRRHRAIVPGRVPDVRPITLRYVRGWLDHRGEGTRKRRQAKQPAPRHRAPPRIRRRAGDTGASAAFAGRPPCTSGPRPMSVFAGHSVSREPSFGSLLCPGEPFEDDEPPTRPGDTLATTALLPVLGRDHALLTVLSGINAGQVFELDR